MLNEENAKSTLANDSLQQLAKALALFSIETRGRLIEQQQVERSSEDASELHEATLSRGQVPGGALG
jgi:hypothetical protein